MSRLAVMHLNVFLELKPLDRPDVNLPARLQPGSSRLPAQIHVASRELTAADYVARWDDQQCEFIPIANYLDDIAPYVTCRSYVYRVEAAGAVETSLMLFLLPGLVPPSVKEAEVHSGADWSALVRIARAASWPGYLGSPRVATAAQGARIIRALADTTVAYTLKILDGMDPREIPRLGDMARDSPENVAIDDDALRHERQLLRKQEEWLTRKKLR